jgi:DNA repair protein RadC
MSLGAAALSNSELLAVLIETGTREKNAILVAQSALAWASEGSISDEGSLRRLLLCSLEEICRIPGLGKVKACRIKAALELGQRLQNESSPKTFINTPGDVSELLMEEMRHLEQEQMKVVQLGIKNQVLGVDLVSVGTVGSSLVHPREVFKNAIRRNATAVILVHNHPSGDSTPSTEDVSVTRRVLLAGRILGIEVVDHIVIGDKNYTSLREAGADFGPD